nr:hypothetical protein 3 [Pelagibacterales bacterium]
MAELPEYLTDQTEEEILKRMLSNIPDDLDKAEGSYIWDALSPASIELALAAIWAQQILKRGFASTTFGEYLDLRCEEHGITRKAPVKATGQVKFTGVAETIVPLGTLIATPSSSTDESSKEFETIEEVTLDSSGVAYASIEALEAGENGNVAAGTITILGDNITGVSSVTNETATTGGADEESDEALRERFLQKVRNPVSGGNRADYVNWALEVQNVGGVTVIPAENGGGTVGVYIIDQTKVPASQESVNNVQNHIAPPHSDYDEDNQFVLSGYGVTTDTTQSGALDGSAIKFIYDSNGEGEARRSSLESLLPQPGIWMLRPHLKVDDNTGTNTLLQVGVWNVTTGTWAKKSESSTEDAIETLTAADLNTAFQYTTGDPISDSKYWPISLDFYWNGQDQLEVVVTRKQTDKITTVWLDNTVYISAFSKDTGEGLAPIGARVTVLPAIAVQVSVSVTLVIAEGYDQASVESAVTQNIDSYIKGLAFLDDNDVRYVRVGNAILDTEGVKDYSNLTINGGTSNISIATKEVAVLGTVTFS